MPSCNTCSLASFYVYHSILCEQYISLLSLLLQSLQTFAQYEENFRQKLAELVASGNPLVSRDTEMHIYSSFAYDAMYAAALALNDVDIELKSSGSGLTLSNFTYDGTSGITEMIFNALEGLSFNGISVSAKLAHNYYRNLISRELT